MVQDNGIFRVPADGTYIASVSGGELVGIMVDGRPDPAPFESTLPDAHLQTHRRELLLRAGQVVTTSPPGRRLWVDRVDAPGLR